MNTDYNRDDRQLAQQAAQYRHDDPQFARWAQGSGVIRHTDETQARIHDIATRLEDQGRQGDGVAFYELLAALDRLTSAGLWLVVHQTYARNVYLDGRPLDVEDFKVQPDGHTGGSLNMVPAYAGYLAANVLTSHTRAWLMGQGHCVAAVDSLVDVKALVEIARAATRETVALRAMSRLADPHTLGSVARHAASEAARMGALAWLRERGERAEFKTNARRDALRHPTMVATKNLIAEITAEADLGIRGAELGVFRGDA